MNSNDQIKDAFQKAKKDISDLRVQIAELSSQISELRSLISDRQTNQHSNQQTPSENPAFQHKTPTQNPQKTIFSTRNEGVPTDRQTDQQTDRHIINEEKTINKPNRNSQRVRLIEVSNALRGLESLKQELKAQFTSLTKQEMLIFTTIYQLENQGFIVDYSLLSSKLKLTESSIRDYVLKITRKGLPILKNKQNNKKILLSISSELKKIASLQAILALKQM